MVVKRRGAEKKVERDRPLKERLAKGTYKKNNDPTKTAKLTTATKLFSPRTSVNSNSRTPVKKRGDKKKTTYNKADFYKHFKPPDVDLTASDGFDFLKDSAHVNRVRKASEQFYDKLTKYDNDLDLSEVILFDDYFVNGRIQDNTGDTCVPLLSNPGVASYGLIVISPKSHYGPVINTEGITIVIFVDVQDNKVLFESKNLNEKKKVVCYKQVQLLILPEDIFIIHNQSVSISAKLLVISFKRDGKELDDIK